ncbi:hypothetical protein K435DRAFT_856665 [Dendrothele bispora CBS 962.96]|uniref:Ribonuclease H1 N-terminal domain-containing protein n=1 Tax=Dendrothele bispora (strain CBS 962.96) TaxID=1314807 RepID=A0A4S8M7W7_DENBC|nr:hypothetical protein K435DRAFT_856665 [Dendrothele bispora CBS 962.96]
MSSLDHEETVSDTSSDELWSELEDLQPYMSQVPSRPCCRPQLYDRKSLNTQFKPKKFYLIFTGSAAGCYTTWADTSGRVVGVKGARHESYDTYDQAEHAWRQNCVSHHIHPVGFVDGTIYVHPPSSTQPRAITPPPAESQFTHSRSPLPNQSEQGTTVPRSSTPTSPSRSRVARAFFGEDSPRREVVPPSSRRRWAIMANGITGVFDAEDGDAVLEEARLRAIPVQAREVESLVEATEWLERLDLSTEGGSE